MNLKVSIIKRKILSILKKNNQILRSKVRAKNKIFVIGRNKTGTTSLKKAFLDFGYIVGDQRTAERLQKDYLKCNFKPIIKYCRTAEVFQDYPFSYPETFKFLDEAYPNSKFILTIRESPEQWYNSVTKFHAKLFGKGKIPTKVDLENAMYIEKGWMWKNFSYMYKPQNNKDIYNKENLIKSYNNYNNEILNFFINRPKDLLVLDLSKKGAYKEFSDFIGVKTKNKDFPWVNKTSTIETRK